jgi:hypothetical protein
MVQTVANAENCRCSSTRHRTIVIARFERLGGQADWRQQCQPGTNCELRPKRLVTSFRQPQCALTGDIDLSGTRAIRSPGSLLKRSICGRYQRGRQKLDCFRNRIGRGLEIPYTEQPRSASVVNTVPCTAPVLGSVSLAKGAKAQGPSSSIRDHQPCKALCRHNSFITTPSVGSGRRCGTSSA